MVSKNQSLTISTVIRLCFRRNGLDISVQQDVRHPLSCTCGNREEAWVIPKENKYTIRDRKD